MIGLVRFAGRPNLVSARVPSQTVFTLSTYQSAGLYKLEEPIRMRVSFVLCSIVRVYSHNLDVKVIELEDVD